MATHIGTRYMCSQIVLVADFRQPAAITSPHSLERPTVNLVSCAPIAQCPAVVLQPGLFMSCLLNENIFLPTTQAFYQLSSQ